MYASLTGRCKNTTVMEYSSVTGGYLNKATEEVNVMSSGETKTAFVLRRLVIGGYVNKAIGD